MKIYEVVDALERFAPLPLQESYDNAGLQIGLTEAEISRVLLCLDVTESVVDEAIAKGCNMIVAHHPLIFRKLAHITGQTYVERCVAKVIKNDIALVAMHTNMDSAEGGVNHKIAEKMSLSDVEFIGDKREVNGVAGGTGVVGTLPEPMSAADFMSMLKERFGVDNIQANELLSRPITKVAVCGGAGSFLLEAAMKAGADAFVTGEMHYHEFFGHDQEVQIAVIGHYQSEQFTAEIFRDILEPMGVECVIAETNTNPIINI